MEFSCVRHLRDVIATTVSTSHHLYFGRVRYDGRLLFLVHHSESNYRARSGFVGVEIGRCAHHLGEIVEVVERRFHLNFKKITI